ncbi:MAG: undecaprenyldiphospho-muramoylpentapeptide beta-N-acetylglucosaminyltransferase [Candidatus Binataceae bacterium]
MKVIIAGGGTGGHLFPAVALGEELRRQRPGTEVLFVGTSAGLEARWLPMREYKYELFEVHGLRGHGFVERIRGLAEFFSAVAQSLGLLRSFGADLVVSAGGYASAPMGVAAILRRVPLVLMEQNATAGLTNRMLWRFADKICVAFEAAASSFSPAKVEVTGNPLRFIPSSSYQQPVDNLARILVLGGSSGAHRLNLGILGAFTTFNKDVIKLQIVHQTGEADVELASGAYQRAALDAQVVPFIDNMAYALDQADLIVARAGGNTVSEIAAAAKPAIFVPYPFHRDRQQELNAGVIEQLGGAVIVRDDEHLADNLRATIERLTADRARLAEMGRRAHRAARPDAAARIATICFQIAEKVQA